MIDFMRTIVMLCCYASLCVVASTVTANEISFLYIGEVDSAAHLGARQGLSEANAQGEFLNTQYILSVASPGQAKDPLPTAIIAAVSAVRLAKIADEYRDVPILNIAASDAFLRENCRDNLFHIGASDTMLADAERQWQRKMPGTPARAQIWHKSFRKYAAGQLNSRFTKQFGQIMNDDSWSGWAAVKLLADTIVRQPSLSGIYLIEELKTNLAFDGQKGTHMSFRETGQLRQPLLLVDDDKIVGEAPVRGIVNSANLDSLGIEFCPK